MMIDLEDVLNLKPKYPKGVNLNHSERLDLSVSSLPTMCRQLPAPFQDIVVDNNLWGGKIKQYTLHV